MRRTVLAIHSRMVVESSRPIVGVRCAHDTCPPYLETPGLLHLVAARFRGFDKATSPMTTDPSADCAGMRSRVSALSHRPPRRAAPPKRERAVSGARDQDRLAAPGRAKVAVRQAAAAAPPPARARSNGRSSRRRTSAISCRRSWRRSCRRRWATRRWTRSSSKAARRDAPRAKWSRRAGTRPASYRSIARTCSSISASATRASCR